MIDYYDTKLEIDIKKNRIRALNRQKESVKNSVMKLTSQIKEVVVFTGTNADRMTQYLIDIEEIEQKIADKEAELKELEETLKEMETALRKMKGEEVKIFCLRFIDKKRVTEIANILNYDRTSIYNKINKIKEKYGLKRL